MNDATVAPLWEIGPFDLPQADMLSLNGTDVIRALDFGEELFSHSPSPPS